jgi:hypothetical protein
VPSINYLQLIDKMPFPSTRAEIVHWVQEHGGSEEAVEAFRAMPGQYYDSITDVNRNLAFIAILDGEDSGSLPSLRN